MQQEGKLQDEELLPTSMAREKQLLIADFKTKSFNEQKGVLFGILSKLYSSKAPVVTDLWNIVYNLDETRHDANDILTEAYNILLDAIYKTQLEELNKSIKKLEEAKEAVLEMKWREEQDKKQEMASNDMTEMFNFT